MVNKNRRDLLKFSLALGGAAVLGGSVYELASLLSSKPGSNHAQTTTTSSTSSISAIPLAFGLGEIKRSTTDLIAALIPVHNHDEIFSQKMNGIVQNENLETMSSVLKDLDGSIQQRRDDLSRAMDLASELYVLFGNLGSELRDISNDPSTEKIKVFNEKYSQAGPDIRDSSKNNMHWSLISRIQDGLRSYNSTQDMKFVKQTSGLAYEGAGMEMREESRLHLRQLVADSYSKVSDLFRMYERKISGFEGAPGAPNAWYFRDMMQELSSQESEDASEVTSSSNHLGDLGGVDLTRWYSIPPQYRQIFSRIFADIQKYKQIVDEASGPELAQLHYTLRLSEGYESEMNSVLNKSLSARQTDGKQEIENVSDIVQIMNPKVFFLQGIILEDRGMAGKYHSKEINLLLDGIDQSSTKIEAAKKIIDNFNKYIPNGGYFFGMYPQYAFICAMNLLGFKADEIHQYNFSRASFGDGFEDGSIWYTPSFNPKPLKLWKASEIQATKGWPTIINAALLNGGIPVEIYAKGF